MIGQMRTVITLSLASLLTSTSFAFSFFPDPSDRLIDAGDCLYLGKYMTKVKNGSAIYAENNSVLATITKVDATHVRWQRHHYDDPNSPPLIVDVELDREFITAYFRSKGSVLQVFLCKR
jgi:hypothetical protein